MYFKVFSCSTGIFSSLFPVIIWEISEEPQLHFSLVPTCALGCERTTLAQRPWLPLGCIWTILLGSPLHLWSVWEQLMMSIARIRYWAVDQFCVFQKTWKFRLLKRHSHKPQPHYEDIRAAMTVQSIFTSNLLPFDKSFLLEGNCGWSSFVQFL